MARNNKKAIADLTGKIGPIVIYTMNGKTIARSIPRKRTKTLSVKARASQQAFAHVMKLMQQVAPIVKIGFSQTAHLRTAFQEAMSINLNAFRQAENPEQIESWLQLSAGTREGFKKLKMEPTTNGIRVKWNFRKSTSDELKNDVVIAVAINRQTHEAFYSMGNAVRHQKTTQIHIPDSKNSNLYSVFIFAVSNIPETEKNSSRISQSQWVGNVEI